MSNYMKFLLKCNVDKPATRFVLRNIKFNKGNLIYKNKYQYY